MLSDRERQKKICQLTSHHFQEVYYGWECADCHLFYAYGCAPWEEDADSNNVQADWLEDN